MELALVAEVNGAQRREDHLVTVASQHPCIKRLVLGALAAHRQWAPHRRWSGTWPDGRMIERSRPQSAHGGTQGSPPARRTAAESVGSHALGCPARSAPGPVPGQVHAAWE